MGRCVVVICQTKNKMRKYQGCQVFKNPSSTLNFLPTVLSHSEDFILMWLNKIWNEIRTFNIVITIYKSNPNMVNWFSTNICINNTLIVDQLLKSIQSRTLYNLLKGHCHLFFFYPVIIIQNKTFDQDLSKFQCLNVFYLSNKLRIFFF